MPLMPPPSPLGRYDIEETAATTCDKDIKKDWMLETHGPLAVTPAMMKVPDSFIPIFNIDGNLGGRAAAAEYDERTYAACGLAFIFNGTATYGTNPPAADRLVQVLIPSSFWDWVQGTTSVTTEYAYFGHASYVSAFYAKTSTGTVKIPSWRNNMRTTESSVALGRNNDGIDWDMLEHKCKYHK